ncbi:MAG: methylenetetrahydrofolate--tRNA-(uracil(54)-C(5))-methyltransferase (FADH(2)-oxidizing) TrmFO [Anaerolineae bacterium]|nr:methylenetetrahydrofolate--tRNA-(uracil(54)-C(5))-methyltransferase (FADH(2)-oxidizing) TrmFO [Anaerolineae bacterium]
MNILDHYHALTVIGGGLAGSEAAWQAASRGIKVRLFEMRPSVSTGAHQSGKLAELVCSNSLGSNLPDRAAGVLKNELRTLNSLLIKCADTCAVPAGGALAVDREMFSALVTEQLENHPNIEVVQKEVSEIPDGPVIIASGPLTSPGLTRAIQQLTGYDQIFFYDALAPIVYRESINMEIAYQASRYGKGSEEGIGDYLNCPMTKDEYDRFVDELLKAERIDLHEFETNVNLGVTAGVHRYFEGCLPIEIIAMRGVQALAYGPMRPIGLTDPRTGAKAYAVVQLRQDNLAKTLYNLVGFQTNLKHNAQERLIRMIPGLEQAEFARFGQMHRNTFIFSPALLDLTLQYRQRDGLFFAGQITGVEGYIGNIATGLVAGWNAANYLLGEPLIEMPSGTIIGALCNYISHANAKDFQPMKANFGILPEFEEQIKGKRKRAAAFAERSSRQIQQFIARHQEVVNKLDCV